MGISLDAAVALPCCLAILAKSAGLALPLGLGVNKAAKLAVYSARKENAGIQSYRCVEEEREGCVLYRVETEPQKMVESLSFVRDVVITVGHELKSGQKK